MSRVCELLTMRFVQFEWYDSELVNRRKEVGLCCFHAFYFIHVVRLQTSSDALPSC